MSRVFALAIVSLLVFGMMMFGCVGQSPTAEQSVSATLSQLLGPNQCQSQASQCAPAAANGSIYLNNPPQYTMLGNKPVLFYEIYLANHSIEGLNRLEVLDGKRVLQTVAGADLNKTIRAPGRGISDYAFYMWVELAPGDKPVSISHKLYFDGQTVEGGNAAINYATPMTIAPPVYGSGWLAAEGPYNFNHHREAIIESLGAMGVPQRYAIDWIKYGPNGKIYKDNYTTNDQFFCYGQEIHAVADGEIVDVKDGVPENIPFTPSPPFSVTWAGGNYVMQQIGNTTYAFYAHMIPGSLNVKIGDKVKTGDVLGRLGNSGNSDAPHLHFQLDTTKDPLFSQPLPYVFPSYEWDGNADWVAQVMADAPWDSAFAQPIIVNNSMPAYDDVVTLGPVESSTLIYQSAVGKGVKYTTKNGKFTVLNLHGSYYEMGRQYGYLMKDEMQEAYNRTMAETAAMGMPAEYVELSGDMLYNSYSEKYVSLMDGMANTSGLTLRQQKDLNGGVISLIEAYIVKSYNDRNITASQGCSAAVFWGNYSKDGKLYFGRNWDMVQSLLSPYLKYMTLAVYHPEGGGNAVANLEFVGEVYTETAMNDKGIFLELNNGAQSDPSHYGGRNFAAEKLFDFMFDSSNMDDISREFNTTAASDSYVIQVADKNAAYSFEWPTFGVRQRSENVSGLLVAYNSFVPPYPADWEGKIAPAPTSDPRRDNMLKMAELPEYKGKMDVELMKQFLAVGVADGGGMLPSNVYQVIAVPEDYKMWIHGQNYSGWEEVDLKPLFDS